MVLHKFGEAMSIVPENIQDTDEILSNSDLELNERMKKFAQELKTIAPQASDFLYFTAVMMHAAEASLIDDNGQIKKDASGNPVTAHWEKLPSGGVKWVCSDPSIMPYKNSNCFVAGTHILMADGSVKNIEDIEVGDEVITHKGRVRKVTETFINEFDGNLLNISIRNNRNILTTSEHPFYQLKVSGESDTQKHLLRRASSEKTFEFTEAKDLKKYDILTSPVIERFVESSLSEQEAWLLGVFAAEGSYAKKYNDRQEIIATFNINEKDSLAKKFAGTLQECYKDLSVRVIEKPDRSVCEVKASGKVAGQKISDYFYSKVGEYSSEKTLSEDIVFGPQNIKEQFIIGWLEGDGHVGKDWGKIIGVTTSKNLASQLRIMLHSLGVWHGLYLEKSSGEKIINKDYGPVSCLDSFRIEIPATSGQNLIKKSSFLNFTNRGSDKNQVAYFENYFIGNTISSINEEKFSGYVYNFEVEEDHSYIANNIAVHNCDIFPESELKVAYPKWVGRPLCLDHKSSSVDMIRGVIVDTHWDEARKRIVALCALDKKNYPDLARKVASGYATNVSMGTAVGRAVCTEDGCHRVAKVESDFCDHMRKRSCYGEINLDLSPIELSLVVTGADPKAKVKHIIAKDLSEARKAASALQDYLDGKIAIASVEDAEVELIKAELAKLNERVASLQNSLEKAEASDGDENKAHGPTESSHEMKESETDVHKPAYSAPEEWASYAEQLSLINNKLDKISSLHNSEGSTMTQKKAYWQGTEEPTPGRTQYPVDPGESARMQDKHMVGQSPFPDVGPVDGMHPGVESHEGSEEERKRRLQRLAEQQRRQEMRKAALADAKKNLESFAYPQGTEEPTDSGKPQYTPDPLGDKAREEDKHLVGKKPFPEVGAVDGLYGDDLKTKEMLSRAKLKATFKKASNNGKLDKASSRWEVSAGDHLILTASVDEITRGNADSIYDMVATADFGRSMIKHIQAEGFEAARSKFKGAQAAPAMGAGTPGTPMNEGEPTAAPAMDDMGDMGDMGDAPSETELKDALEEVAQIVDDTLNDVSEGDKAIEEDASTIEAVDPAPTDEAGFARASVSSMRKTVNAMLGESFKETIATLKAHKDELETAKAVLGKYASFDPKHKLYFASLVDKASSEAKKTVADCGELTNAFVRYAHGTSEHLKKTAQDMGGWDQPSEEQKSPFGEPSDGDFGDLDKFLSQQEAKPGMTDTDEMGGDAMADDMYAKDKKEDKDSDDKKDKDEDKKDKKENPFAKKDDDKKEDKEEDKEDDDNDGNDGLFKELPSGTEVTIEQDGDVKATVASAPDLTTKEGRAMYRAKLAQKGMEFSDMLGKAHPEGGHTPEKMDTKPSGDLAKVERIDEVSKAMHDLANMPPKVRKQAQEIAQLVESGKLAAEDVDGLAAYAVDKDAIAYYKKYWAEAKDSESSEFANKLVEEQKHAKAEAELETQTLKIKRAHELAYEMRDRGMIDTSQINQQVKEILSWNDEGFNSVKNIVAKQEPMSKTASVPQVGLLHSGDVYLPSAVSSAESGSGSHELTAALEAHFANKRL